LASSPLLLRTASTPSEPGAGMGEGRRAPVQQQISEGRQMIVYGSSLSPYVRKVLALAAEKGIDVELQSTGSAPGRPNAEFLEASPFRKMPALRDGDYMLADSSAIAHYIEAKQPEPVMIPAEPKLRGRTVWFDEFADTILVSCGAKIFFNRIVGPRFLGRECDEEAVKQAEVQELPPILEYLENIVPADGEYLVGDRLTLADIAVANPFANFRHTKTNIDRTRYPRTVAYVERILARPSLAQWVEREAAFLAMDAA
jgi:glutathione S-transferase